MKKVRGGSSVMSQAPRPSLPGLGIRCLPPERTACNGLKNSWKVSSVIEPLVVLMPENPHFIKLPLAAPRYICAKPGLGSPICEDRNNMRIYRLTKAALECGMLLDKNSYPGDISLLLISFEKLPLALISVARDIACFQHLGACKTPREPWMFGALGGLLNLFREE